MNRLESLEHRLPLDAHAGTEVTDCTPGDINCDGYVNSSDIIEVLRAGHPPDMQSLLLIAMSGDYESGQPAVYMPDLSTDYNRDGWTGRLSYHEDFFEPFKFIVNDAWMDDLEAIHFGIHGVTPAWEWLDVNDDGRVGTDDLRLGYEAVGWTPGDLNMELINHGFHAGWMHDANHPTRPDGIVTQDELDYFESTDSLFGQKRETGEFLWWFEGDIDGDGRATEHDILLARASYDNQE